MYHFKNKSSKDREQIARAFIAKPVYNFQTTRDLIDRLHIDRTLRILCGWRHSNNIPSESKFSRAFKELSDLKIAEKTHEQFVKEYLSEKVFYYNATDATKTPLREKAVKKNKEEPKMCDSGIYSHCIKHKAGRPKKGVTREPIKPTILKQQQEMRTVKEMLSLVSRDCGVGIKQSFRERSEEILLGC